MKKSTSLFIIFRLSCFGIFAYQAWNLFEDYSKERTLADIRSIKQDKYPLPLICITTKLYSLNNIDFFNKTFNITINDFVWGKWKVDGLSEIELWDFLSSKLPDLIDKIVVYKTLKSGGEKYSTVKISVKNLPGFGVDIERKDFWYNPRIFCLSFRNTKVFIQYSF